MRVAPQATASSMAEWMSGRSKLGRNSFGTTRVEGRIRVPRPAAMITASSNGVGIRAASDLYVGFTGLLWWL